MLLEVLEQKRGLGHPPTSCSACLQHSCAGLKSAHLLKQCLVNCLDSPLHLQYLLSLDSAPHWLPGKERHLPCSIESDEQKVSQCTSLLLSYQMIGVPWFCSFCKYYCKLDGSASTHRLVYFHKLHHPFNVRYLFSTSHPSNTCIYSHTTVSCSFPEDDACIV